MYTSLYWNFSKLLATLACWWMVESLRFCFLPMMEYRFFCDLLANQIPGGLDGLTEDNFRSTYTLFYYECHPSTP